MELRVKEQGKKQTPMCNAADRGNYLTRKWADFPDGLSSRDNLINRLRRQGR